MNRTVAEEIRRLRVKAGYSTLGDLYRVSRVTVSTLSRIEAGIQNPSPATLKKLAPFLGVAYEHLMTVAGYLPSQGQAVAKDEKGSQVVLDIDQVINDDTQPIMLGGRLVSPELRQVLKENLNLIRRLTSTDSSH